MQKKRKCVVKGKNVLEYVSSLYKMCWNER